MDASSILWFGALFALVVVGLLMVSHPLDRPFSIVLILVSLYYGCFAPLYWMTMEGGAFLGVNWAGEVPFACALVLGSSAAWISLLLAWRFVLGVIDSSTIVSVAPSSSILPPSRLFFVFLVLGGIGAVYVVAIATLKGGDIDGDPFLRIAYQFADLLVPALVFVIAWNGFTRNTLIALTAFVGYAIFLGFRYKLVLIFAPLLICSLLMAHQRGKRALAMALGKVSLAVLGLLVLFGVMTLTRQKFGGLDLSGLSGANHDDLLYGFFAEGNTIFGLSSIILNFTNNEHFLGTIPIVDAFKDLLPRFLFPARSTGTYVEWVLHGLIAPQAAQSGTAYPYLGELLLMGGYPALCLGVAVLAGITCIANRALVCVNIPIRVRFCGVGLVAVYLGYYYFSRGYFSQGFKGLLFVLLPYIALARASRINSGLEHK